MVMPQTHVLSCSCAPPAFVACGTVCEAINGSDGPCHGDAQPILDVLKREREIADQNQAIAHEAVQAAILQAVQDRLLLVLAERRVQLLLEVPLLKAEGVIRQVLEHIGEDPLRTGLVETPDRVVRSWKEIYKGYSMNPKEILGKTFPEDHTELVVLRDVEFFSQCEHHMLPFFGRAHIGYLPEGRVVGISKLARLVEVFSRRLQIQERLGQQIADAIMEHLQPSGCGVVLEAQHFCMVARGVAKQNSVMVTSSLRGSFRDDSTVRAEFLNFVKGS